MSVKSWAKLAMRVAMNDLTNLQQVFDVAQKLDKKTPEDPAPPPPPGPPPMRGTSSAAGP